MEKLEKKGVPIWVQRMNSFNTYMSQKALGGPQLIKMAWAINLHKFSTMFVVGLLMVRYQNFSPVAWVYLALHGTYGICWLLKHFAFHDPRWETRVTLGGALFTFLFLGTYWIAPYLLISGSLGLSSYTPANWLIAICIGLHSLGLVIMSAADCQKHFTLKYERKLITSGMFKLIRRPNYLGEMMLYAAYALLVHHWLPWLVLAYWWITIFLVNMVSIESSLSRYPEWKEYEARTGMLLPWF